MKIEEIYVEILSFSPDSEKLIEQAGRTCYASLGRTTDTSHVSFIKQILSNGHLSVLEHSYVTFKIITDLSVSHQLVRHRHLSFSQQSTRYCNFSHYKFGEEITVVKPFNLNKCAEDIWFYLCKESERAYFAMLESGCKPEQAARVLPRCLKTELVVTSNFRGWLEYLKTRISGRTMPEHKHLAELILKELIRIAPNVFGGQR